MDICKDIFIIQAFRLLHGPLHHGCKARRNKFQLHGPVRTICHHGNPPGELFYNASKVKIQTFFIPSGLDYLSDIPYVFYISRNAVPVSLNGTGIGDPLSSVFFNLILFAFHPASHNAAESARRLLVMEGSITFFAKTARRW